MTIPSQPTPEDSLPFDPGTVESVVEHMNSDHADACLKIVRAFSEQGDAATRAKLINMDKEGLIFEVQTDEGRESTSNQNVRVNFSKPLRNGTQIRGALVGLTRQARQKLAD